ncbi:DUF1707 SHOCT-like domain-containing protein [Streptomyces sp. DSM 40750]|uniref:DUF1707 SHOCT-like domain-containing protein n=1 Tax=Streptomyces sp. DSM 40750 TaxID=2801030 RepID=UPI00214CB6CE|nr:DUF1707 domain-containing protein [Streptomyces sp. DSM 40750]UUU22464.1 DUF1707 domain-containing protein [Streptomyces sp. DSM 40750]
MTDDLPDLPAAMDLRASDADRERVSEQLRDALAEGRLDMEEFEERLDATYKARTYGELAPITRDLPGAGTLAPPTVVPPSSVSLVKGPAAGASWPERIVGGEGSSTWGVAVMSGFERKGRWTVPKRFDCFAFWGGGELDLRDADFAEREVTINCVTIMGGINVIVPPGVEVVVRGIGIMGGFDHSEEGVPGDPGAPRVVITGFAFWGGVGVERKVPKAERQREKEARRQERLERREARRELRASRRDHLHDLHDGHRDAMEQVREAMRSEREQERRRKREY